MPRRVMRAHPGDRAGTRSAAQPEQHRLGLVVEGVAEQYRCAVTGRRPARRNAPDAPRPPGHRCRRHRPKEHARQRNPEPALAGGRNRRRCPIRPAAGGRRSARWWAQARPRPRSGPGIRRRRTVPRTRPRPSTRLRRRPPTACRSAATAPVRSIVAVRRSRQAAAGCRGWTRSVLNRAIAAPPPPHASTKALPRVYWLILASKPSSARTTRCSGGCLRCLRSSKRRRMVDDRTAPPPGRRHPSRDRRAPPAACPAPAADRARGAAVRPVRRASGRGHRSNSGPGAFAAVALPADELRKPAHHLGDILAGVLGEHRRAPATCGQRSHGLARNCTRWVTSCRHTHKAEIGWVDPQLAFDRDDVRIHQQQLATVGSRTDRH